ncbi:MAG: peptidyl-prolyl cis-trans isomerase [Candidatus Omnitrophota bacterium]
MFKCRTIAVIAAVFIALAAFGCKAANKPETGNQQIGKKEASMAAPVIGEVVAEIGNEKITMDELNSMIKSVPKQYQAAALTHKDIFLDGMINQKLLYSEALRERVDKDPAIQRQVEDVVKDVIIREYLKREIEDKVAVSDEDARSYYEANKDKFREPEKIKVSHILVDTEDEAKDVLAKLQGGADFAVLAKERSKCPSKEKGGSLGFVSHGQTVPEFEEAIFNLQTGQLSGVVKTQFGYHVIKVDERQPERDLTFEEVKDQLKQTLLAEKRKERFEAMLKSIREKENVVVHKDILQPSFKEEQQPVLNTEKAEPVQSEVVTPENKEIAPSSEAALSQEATPSPETAQPAGQIP